jgi:choline transport protein
VYATLFCGRYGNQLLRELATYTSACAVLFATGLGAIPLGSSTAFIDLTGSFVILTTISYAIPITANLLTGRKYLPQGPFWLGKSGYFVNTTAVLLLSVFDIFYCFRKHCRVFCFCQWLLCSVLLTIKFLAYSVPTSAMAMNYNSLILVGVVALTGIWWIIHGLRNYSGPRLTHLYIHEESETISFSQSEERKDILLTTSSRL